MLTFLISLTIMFTVVWSSIRWAKRKEARQAALATEFDGVEEVFGSARDHR